MKQPNRTHFQLLSSMSMFAFTILQFFQVLYFQNAVFYLGNFNYLKCLEKINPLID